MRQRISIILVILSLSSPIIAVFSQEVPAQNSPLGELTVEPSPNETTPPIATEILPTEASIEAASPTAEAILEATMPTAETTPEPTAEVTPEPAAETTPEPAAEVTSEPTVDPTSKPAIETDPLSLIFSTGFEAAASELSVQGWLAVDVDGGKALQSGAEASTLTYNTAYADAALGLRTLLNDGTLSLALRQNAESGYVFILNHDGTAKLLRNGAEVAAAQVALVPGEWITLEARAIGGALSASLNGATILSTMDAAPLPLGGLSVSSSAAALLRIDDLTILASGSGTPQSTPTTQPTETATATQPTETATATQPTETAIATQEATSTKPAATPTEGGDGPGPIVMDTPPAPVLSSTGSTPTSIGLSWTNVANETAYHLERSADGGTTWTEIATTAADATIYSDTGLFCGATYKYRVRAFNGTFSPYSNILSRATSPCTAVLAPVLAAPASAALTKNTTPELIWNAVASASKYEIQVATNSTFTNVVASANDLTALSFTPADALPNDGLYYWRVRAYNAAQTPVAGPFSAARTFTVDTIAPTLAPNLSAPANGLLSSATKPAFSWAAVTGAASYIIQIADEDSFSNPLISQVVTTTKFTPTAPLPQGLWYWRVLARDLATNEGPFSLVRAFTVNLQTAPLNNGFVYTTSTASSSVVTFTWAAYGITGTSYTLEISSDEFFNGVFFSKTTTALTYKLTTAEALTHGSYWWRVQVNSTVPPLEVQRKFTVSPPVPPAPVLTSPLTAFNSASDAVNLAWNAPTYAFPLTYEVQVDNQTTFLSPEYTEGGIAAPGTTAGPLLDGLYNWRVRAVNEFGGMSAWSAVRSFTVDTTPPAAPALSAPLDGAFISSNRPTLTAIASATATGYRFDLATDSDFNNLLLPDAPSATISLALSASVLSSPLPQGRYYWRVQARDAAGNWSVESSARSFTVSLLTAPANNTSFFIATKQAVKFTWVSAGVVGVNYTLHVASDEFFGNIIFTKSTTALSYTMTAAEALTHGRYWVRLMVGYDVPPPEATHKFSVSPLAPPAPVLSSPATAFVTASPAVNLAWNAPAYAFPLSYEVQVDNQTTFASPEWPLIDTPSITSTSITTSDLPTGVYSWRVRAVNEFGGAGAWSAVRTFTVDTTPTTAPNLTLPADAASLTTLKPAFSWAAPVGAVRYELRLSHDSGFSRSVLFFMTTPKFTISNDLNNASYWWSVRAYDAAGNPSPWSVARSFTARSLSTFVPTLCRSSSPSLSLNWERVSWAAAYEYQVSTTPGFELLNLAAFGTISGNPSAPTATTGTLGNGRYFWRVRAQSSAGVWGPWSTVSSCSVAAP